MAIKHGKPNPLNFFDLRRVNFLSPHFRVSTIDKYNPNLIKNFDNWIKNNLTGRYYIGQGIDLDTGNNIVYTTEIGFETEKELSFFTIACPFIQTR
jgi:hypothetical protein